MLKCHLPPLLPFTNTFSSSETITCCTKQGLLARANASFIEFYNLEEIEWSDDKTILQMPYLKQLDLSTNNPQQYVFVSSLRFISLQSQLIVTSTRFDSTLEKTEAVEVHLYRVYYSSAKDLIVHKTFQTQFADAQLCPTPARPVVQILNTNTKQIIVSLQARSPVHYFAKIDLTKGYDKPIIKMYQVLSTIVRDKVLDDPKLPPAIDYSDQFMVVATQHRLDLIRMDAISGCRNLTTSSSSGYVVANTKKRGLGYIALSASSSEAFSTPLSAMKWVQNNNLHDPPILATMFRDKSVALWVIDKTADAISLKHYHKTKPYCLIGPGIVNHVSEKLESTDVNCTFVCMWTDTEKHRSCFNFSFEEDVVGYFGLEKESPVHLKLLDLLYSKDNQEEDLGQTLSPKLLFFQTTSNLFVHVLGRKPEIIRPEAQGERDEEEPSEDASVIQGEPDEALDEPECEFDFATSLKALESDEILRTTEEQFQLPPRNFFRVAAQPSPVSAKSPHRSSLLVPSEVTREDYRERINHLTDRIDQMHSMMMALHNSFKLFADDVHSQMYQFKQGM